MSKPLDDLAAHLASPEKPQRTPVPRTYDVFMGLGVVKSVNVDGDGSIRMTYNGGNGDGTTTGAGPGIPARPLAGYAPAVGDTVLVYSLGTENWATGVPILTSKWINVGDPGAPAFGSGWSNFGDGFQALSFRRVGDLVQIRGTAATSGSSATAFTLPAGYAPLATYTTLLLSSSGVWQIVVDTSGDVSINGAPAAASSVLFDNQQFSVL